MDKIKDAINRINEYPLYIENDNEYDWDDPTLDEDRYWSDLLNGDLDIDENDEEESE